MVEANLIFHTRHDFKGNLEQITCEWDGPRDGIVKLSDRFLNDSVFGCIVPGLWDAIGVTIKIGPFKLKCFEYDPFSNIYSFIRADSVLGNIKVFAYQLTRWLDLAYRRLIITAAVWKLAEYRPECYPSWEDLHIVQRFRKGR